MTKDFIYTIDEFMKDIDIGLEMEFTFSGKKYTLSRAIDGFIFTDVREQVYAVYGSYEELLASIRIEHFSIIDIVNQQLYEDWYIY